jgi:hypothetical protein
LLRSERVGNLWSYTIHLLIRVLRSRLRARQLQVEKGMLEGIIRKGPNDELDLDGRISCWGQPYGRLFHVLHRHCCKSKTVKI